MDSVDDRSMEGRSMEGVEGRSMEGVEGRSIEGVEGRSMEGVEGRRFCHIFLPLAWAGHVGLGLALGQSNV